MERFDSIIIGNGPSGLSAALTLKNRNKNILILAQSNSSDKVSKAHKITNYLGLTNIEGTKMAEIFKSQVEACGIETIVDPATAVYSMGDYYAIQTRSNKMYEASTIILASGISFGKPYIGEKEFLGRGVSYCATCDAMFYKGKEVVVIGQNKTAEEEAIFLNEVVSKVTYVALYQEEVSLPSDIEVIHDTVTEIKGNLKADEVCLKSKSIKTDGIFILRDNVAPDSLVPGLLIEGGYVSTNRKMETNLNGLFACGDIVGAPYQYIKAAGEGNVAAISAAEYLSKLQKEEK